MHNKRVRPHTPMNSILKSFSIPFLLRSVFSGIFFVLSYYVSSRNPLEFARIDGSTMLSVALPVALFAGVAAYGIHRSLLYPFAEWFFDSNRGKAWRKRIPLISDLTIDTLLWRWDQDPHPAKWDRKVINERFNTWADYIHLQYVSTLCIASGAVVGAIIDSGKHSLYWPLIGLACLLFLAAIVSNWRHHSVLDYIKSKTGQEPINVA